MTRHHKPSQPAHVAGTGRREVPVLHKGREPERSMRHPSLCARVATGINAEATEPIYPDLPHIPPA